MENSFSKKKLSPFTAMGLLLAVVFLVTRGPVLLLMRSTLGLAFTLVRPALFAYGTAKAWGLVDKAITGKTKFASHVPDATEFRQTPEQV